MNTATPKKPGALAFSVTAWGDVRDALTWLFKPALITLLLLVMLETVKALIMPVASRTVDFALKRSSYEAIQAFLMTPYAIAVHRFVILGEVTMGYRIAPAEPRFRRFFGWSLAFLVLSNASWALTLPEQTTLENILGVILYLVLMVVGLRLMVLFPAIAVDAPGANWRQAIADTDGHAWHIFLIIMATMLPFLIVAVAGKVILQGSIPGDAVIAFGAFDAVVGLVGWTLGVVIASRTYQWIAVGVERRG